MVVRRLAFAVLATAGVPVGHIVGYAVAHPGGAARAAALGGHSYLPGVTSLVVPLGVVTAFAWAIRTSRELGMAGCLRTRHLAAAQLGMFLLQETGERALGDAPIVELLAEPALWCGLAAQILVAHVSVRSIGWLRRAIRHVHHGPRVVASPLRLAVRFLPLMSPRSPVTVTLLGSRAPPSVVVTR